MVGITGYNDLLPAQDKDYEYIEYVPPGAWGLKLGRVAEKITNFPKETSNDETSSGQPFSVLIPTNPPDDSAYEIPIPEGRPGQEGNELYDQLTVEAKIAIGTIHIPCKSVGIGRNQNLMSELETRFNKMAQRRAHEVSDGPPPVLPNRDERNVSPEVPKTPPFRKPAVEPPKAGLNPPKMWQHAKGLKPLNISASSGNTYPQDQQATSPQSPRTPTRPTSPRRLIPDKEQYERVFKKSHPEQRISPKILPTTFPKPSKVTQNTSAHGDISGEGACGGQPNKIISLEHVPNDISTLTVTDVADCLHLLNLGEHADKFVREQVDGHFLQSLTAEDIQEGFGLNNIGSRKIEMFARNGWKPNYSSHKIIKMNNK